MEKSRKDLVNDLRQNMARETELALAELEKKMVESIGRLQVRVTGAQTSKLFLF